MLNRRNLPGSINPSFPWGDNEGHLDRSGSHSKFMKFTMSRFFANPGSALDPREIRDPVDGFPHPGEQCEPGFSLGGIGIIDGHLVEK